MQVLALFCNLNALILCYNCLKHLRVTKIFKEIMFERSGVTFNLKNVFADTLQNFSSLFLSLLAAKFAKNSHI